MALTERTSIAANSGGRDGFQLPASQPAQGWVCCSCPWVGCSRSDCSSSKQPSQGWAPGFADAEAAAASEQDPGWCSAAAQHRPGGALVKLLPSLLTAGKLLSCPTFSFPCWCCSLLPHGCFLRSQHRGCHVCHVLCWGSDLVPTLLSCWPCCSRSVLLA